MPGPEKKRVPDARNAGEEKSRLISLSAGAIPRILGRRIWNEKQGRSIEQKEQEDAVHASNDRTGGFVMNGRNRMKTWQVMIVVCIGMLALWGCPKKAEISTVPETQQEKAPAVEATPQPEPQPEQKAEAAKPEDTGAKEMAAAESAGLQPVYFDYDKALIKTEALEILKANGEWLKAHPQVNVRIEGNCDERGTIEYNQALGQRRAASAKKYLTDMGVSGQRITLISYGKEKSVCTENAESCWQKNRRDDFAVVSD
jgi:peptidoglycan-associated lipoprotein